MSKLMSLFKLVRIEHSIMLIIAVIAAEAIAGAIPSPGILILSIITPIFLSMSAFAINDYFDIDTDRKNKKMRPLVTRELKPTYAIYISAISLIIGIASSILINTYCIAIAVIFGALSILYSYWLKRLPILGNAYVAFAMAIPFIYGNYVVSSSINYTDLLIFALIFLSGLAREIHGAIRDYEGDMKVRNAVTLPIAIGIPASSYISFLLYIFSVIISIFMFFYTRPFFHNLIYIVPILISDAMLLYSGYIFLMHKKRSYDKIRNISLIAMGIALVCIFISSFAGIQIPF